MTLDFTMDLQLIQGVSSRLDLRLPNQQALETLARASELYGELEETFEGVIVLATGVGKTYVMAGALDYLSAIGVRDFAIVVPGRTILNKTIANFSAESKRSLLPGMDCTPVVVTAENFTDGATRSAMDDPSRTKLYIFTVQALLGATGETARKTRNYQETLGGPFYDWLQNARDLVVLADEHHIYEGPKFSKAVRELHPRFLFGFTATPSKSARILYHYPLSRAIADKLVKIPVVVGRKDDRTDAKTKLSDGVLLLQWKEQLIERYCARTGKAKVNPIMLVVAESIEEANHYQDICIAPDFFDGQYAGKVLVVTSKSDDEALAMLETVEEPNSPVRILINVAKLKEGWDNAQVYVLAAMRASVSDVLKEQTLGRGLRLPFGEYTDVEGLNTLEVLSHERYEELLRKANLLREQLVDYRAQLEADAQVIKEEVSIPVLVEQYDGAGDAGLPTTTVGELALADAPYEGGGVVLTSLESRQADVAGSLSPIKVLAPRSDVALKVPRLRQMNIDNAFHLADISPLAPFKEAGERLAVVPEEELRRRAITGRVNEESGYVQLMAADLQEQLTFNSPGDLIPLGQSRQALEDLVMASEIVPSRDDEERPALRLILDAFIAGLGADAERVLSANLRRAQEAVTGLIEQKVAQSKGQPRIDWEVRDWIAFDKPLDGKDEFSDNPREKFQPHLAYEGWKKALYPQCWFDSSPERDLALILDNAKELEVWHRLQRGDLTILWTGFDNWYNPDFVAIEKSGTSWVLEVKRDKDMPTQEVQQKKLRASVWANHATSKTGTPWRYLLLSETQLQTAKESWPALRQMAEL